MKDNDSDGAAFIPYIWAAVKDLVSLISKVVGQEVPVGIPSLRYHELPQDTLAKVPCHLIRPSVSSLKANTRDNATRAAPPPGSRAFASPGHSSLSKWGDEP